MLLHTRPLHTAQTGTVATQSLRLRRTGRIAQPCRAIQSPEEVCMPVFAYLGNHDRLIAHAIQVKTGTQENGKVYPNFETTKSDEGLFNLPVREPGSFPEPSTHTPQGAGG